MLKKTLPLITLVMLIILSIATGLTKLFQMPEEMDLFRNAGWNDGQILIFGGLQCLGGLLLAFRRIRKMAAIFMAVTFVTASIVVFLNGMTAFGFFSLLFIALAIYVSISSQLKK